LRDNPSGCKGRILNALCKPARFHVRRCRLAAYSLEGDSLFGPSGWQQQLHLASTLDLHREPRIAQTADGLLALRGLRLLHPGEHQGFACSRHRITALPAASPLIVDWRSAIDQRTDAAALVSTLETLLRRNPGTTAFNNRCRTARSGNSLFRGAPIGVARLRKTSRTGLASTKRRPEGHVETVGPRVFEIG